MRLPVTIAVVVCLAAGCVPAPGSEDGVVSADSDATDEVKARLLEIPGVIAVEPDPYLGASAPSGCSAFFLVFRQPIDHQKPDGATFSQKLVLLHCDVNAPMVFSPAGYSYELSFVRPELIDRLRGNWLWAEHRFFGESTPASDPEQRTLTVRQSADDHHAIVTAFRTQYTGRWISTGVSNGGMNAVFHARFYPDDVDGTVAYVAPFMEGSPDERFPPFIDRQGSDACRAQVLAYQRALYARESELAATMSTADYRDPHASLRTAARRFSFYYWQYNGTCRRFPGSDADAFAMLMFAAAVGALRSDAEAAAYQPYWQQASTELGIGGYSYTGIEDRVTPAEREADASSTHYSPVTMTDISSWLTHDASRIAFVYGEHDPYTAAAAAPQPERDNLLVIAKDHGHEADLEMLADDDRTAVLSHVARWAGVALDEPRSVSIALERGGRRAALTRFRPASLLGARP